MGLSKLFSRLFGKTSQLDRQRELLHVLTQFIQADFDGKKTLLQKHPELLSEEAELMLDELIDLSRRQGQEGVPEIYEHEKNLLYAVKNMGVENVFDQIAEQLDESNQEQDASSIHPEKFRDVMREIYQAQNRSDWETVIRLCREVLSKVKREKDSRFWAELNFNLGASLAQLKDDRSNGNVENAIFHFEQALTVYTRKKFPNHWANINVNLALVYSDRTQGATDENIEKSIEHYMASLKVFNFKESPDEWARIQDSLGLAFWSRISGNPEENIEKAIACYDQALKIRTREYSPYFWSSTLNNKGMAFAQRVLGEKEENLEKAISLYESALEVVTPDIYLDAWFNIQFNLAQAFRGRIFENRGENLDKAITLFRELIDRWVPEIGKTRWVNIHMALAGIYLDRIRGHRPDNHKLAIELYSQALGSLDPRTFPKEWVQVNGELGQAYMEAAFGERAENIEKALECHKSALEYLSQSNDVKQWAGEQLNLGNAYRVRIRGDKAQNIEKAINLYLEAAKVFTHDEVPEQWAGIQNNLGLVFSERLNGEKRENLEEAIFHFEKSLEVRERQTSPDQWAATQINMVSAFIKRIKGNKQENVERAISHAMLALEIYSPSQFPGEWAQTQIALGESFYSRLSGERSDNLEEAIYRLNQSLEVLNPESHSHDWAGVQLSLGLIYSERIKGEPQNNIETAEKYLEMALSVFTRDSDPLSWAKAKVNIAKLLSERVVGGKEQIIESAIVHLEDSLSVLTFEAFPENWATGQNNLGTCFLDRLKGNREENVEIAIEHYENALRIRTRKAFPHEWASTHNNLGGAFAQRLRGPRLSNQKIAVEHFKKALEVRTIDAFPQLHGETQRNLARVLFDDQEWESAHVAYAGAIDASSRLLMSSFTESGRTTEVSEVSHIYACNAYCLLKLRRPVDALLQLEQGKTRLLSEALALGEVDLSLIGAEHANELQEARFTLHELESEFRLLSDSPAHPDTREMSKRLDEARNKLNKTIEKIQSEHQDFMPAGVDLTTMLSLIPQGGALVAPLVTSKGSAVFVLSYGQLTVDETNVIYLPSFDLEALRQLLVGLSNGSQIEGWIGAYRNRNADPKGWKKKIESIGQELWDGFMGAVSDRLNSLGLKQGAEVLLFPQGGMGILPLHCAWRKVDSRKHYFLDDYTITYAPSFYAINISKRRLEKYQGGQRSLLAVINPTDDLIFSQAEGDSLKALFQDDGKYLNDKEATRDAVIQNVSSKAYIHFSCHGFYDWQDPMSSGLVLANGESLTLAEIISKFDLSFSRLVTLSACETGLTDIRKSSDEYIGLPAGFLRAGAPAVVSTLWAVMDLSTMLLMERFFRNHLAEGLSLPPVEALREAQIWLRDVTFGELSDLFELYKESAPDRPRMGYELAENKFTEYTLESDRNACPFDNPYYWGAFTLSGV